MADIYKGFKVTGVEDCLRFMKNFPDKIENRMLSQSVSAAVRQGFATPIKKNIRSVTKKRTGNLLKGVTVRKIKGTKHDYRVFMGAPAYHAHLIEYGTVAHRRAVGPKTRLKLRSKRFRPVKFGESFKMVGQTGHMKATPYFEPGVMRNKKKAQAVLRTQLERKITRYVATVRKAA